MRQDRHPRQQVVVCKITTTTPGEEEALQSPRFAPELSCCLQDPPRRDPRAKPVRRNALSPELRCCLQDCRGGASGPGVAVGCGFDQRSWDSSADTASSNRDCERAISGDCPGRHRGIRDRRRVFSGDTRCGAGAGNRLRRRLPDEAGTSKAENSAGSRGNAVHPYEWRFLIRLVQSRRIRI